MESKDIAIAAEPRWVEVSRGELFRRKVALGALMSKLGNQHRPVLNEEEMALLESLWEMLNDILR